MTVDFARKKFPVLRRGARRDQPPSARWFFSIVRGGFLRQLRQRVLELVVESEVCFTRASKSANARARR